MGHPQQDMPPRVDPVDEPSPLPFHIPVPDDGTGTFPFGNRVTLRAIGRANLAQGAVEEYAHARIEAAYTAPLWSNPVPDTLAAFVELTFEHFRARFYRSVRSSALMVPSWVVDYLAEREQPVNANLIEIPMNPTAPVWEAVGIGSSDLRTPSLARPLWQAFGRYPCRALPEHIEAFAAREVWLRQAREHEQKYAGLGAQLLDAQIITDDPALQQRQLRQSMFDAGHPEAGGRDDR